jgi:hypothetical protein
MPQQPGVSISETILRACMSTTVTEVAGVAFCTNTQRPSAEVRTRLR